MNGHRDVVLGIERYKYPLMSPAPMVEPVSDLFTESRFFEYRPEDSNVKLEEGQYDALYVDAKKKFGQAKYVGDKIPGLYKRYRWLAENFPGATMIHIVRDPREVACSWNGRAKNGRSWPVENDYTKAIPEWNVAISETNAALAQGILRMGVVSYAEIFAVKDPSINRLLRWLGLDMTDAIKEVIKRMRQQARQLEQKRALLDENATKFVDETADWKAFEQLKKRLI